MELFNFIKYLMVNYKRAKILSFENVYWMIYKLIFTFYNILYNYLIKNLKIFKKCFYLNSFNYLYDKTSNNWRM